MELFFNIFQQYGWWGILGIILCMILFLITKYIIKKFNKNLSSGFDKVGEKLTDQLSKQNEQLTNTIVSSQEKLINYLITKDDEKTQNHNNMLNERMTLAEEINQSLKDIMNIHNAQRAFILEFHNSYQNLSGVPFAKYSCNYEWFDKGLQPLANKIIGLPFSSISKVVYDVINSDTQQAIFTDIQSLEDDNPTLVSIFKDPKTKAIVYTGMYDKNNVLIGLLVLEYHNPIEKLNLNQLHIQTAEITSILNIRYKYTKK